MLWINFRGTFCEIVFRWLPYNTFDDKSTLVEVMAWCHKQQAITGANVDPDLHHHMASLSHNELRSPVLPVPSMNPVHIPQSSLGSSSNLPPFQRPSPPPGTCLMSITQLEFYCGWFKFLSQLGVECGNDICWGSHWDSRWGLNTMATILQKSFRWVSARKT